MFVPGAITAKLAAAATKVPAEAALAPAGATYTATGTSDSRMLSTISRVESSNPPGVSNWITTSDAPSLPALSMPRAIWSAVSGSTIPSISMTSTFGPSAKTESVGWNASMKVAAATPNIAMQRRMDIPFPKEHGVARTFRTTLAPS